MFGGIYDDRLLVKPVPAAVKLIKDATMENKPTLIISHNKTLAGQLYSEMKEFFPNNAVEYFVSY